MPSRLSNTRKKPSKNTGARDGLLKPEIVADIRRWTEDGYSVKAILLELEFQSVNVSYSTVSNIARHRTYLGEEYDV